MSGLLGRHGSIRQGGPPSSFRRLNSGGSQSPTSPDQMHNANPVSGNFEDVLSDDGTVHIAPSVDESKLGTMTHSKQRSPGNTSTFVDDSTDVSSRPRNHPQLTSQLATPKGLPLTSEMTPASSSTAIPVNFQSPETSDLEDTEADPKRRSLLRSPGTSSSPDLATLVRKAKERGGIVGADKTPDSKSSLPLQVPEPRRSSSAVKPPASAYLTPTSHPRNRAPSSSSSYCVVPPVSLSPTASRTEPTHGKKGGKSSLAPMPNNASMLSLNFESKDKDSKSSMRAKTGAFFTKLIGNNNTKFKKRANSVTALNSPEHNASLRSPIPPVPTTPRSSISKMLSSDFFSQPPTTGTWQLPPIRGSVDSRASEDDRPHPSSNPTPSSPVASDNPQNATIKAGRRRSMSVGNVDVLKLSSLGSSSRKSSENTTKGITDLTGVVIATDDFRSAFKDVPNPVSPMKPMFDTRTSVSSERSNITWKGKGSAKIGTDSRTPVQNAITTSPSPTLRLVTRPEAVSLPDTPDDFGTRKPRVTSMASDEDIFYTPSSTPSQTCSPYHDSNITVHLATPTSSQNGHHSHSSSSDHSIVGEMTTMASTRVTGVRLPQRGPNPFQALSSYSSTSPPNPRVVPRRNYQQPHPSNRSVSSTTTASAQSTSPVTARPSLEVRGDLQSAHRSNTDPRSPSRDKRVSRIQPRRAASASEPLLVNENPAVAEDGLLSGHREPNRTVRLIPSVNSMGPSGGATGIERRGSTYSHPSSMASSSDLNSSRYPSSAKIPLEPEEVDVRAKEYAVKCWNEDTSFLALDKIAEWLGGTDAVRKQALKYYMDNFDFKGMRLDNAFRHLCNKLYFKGEAQQLDRILVTFSAKFWEYNSLPVYHGPDVVHAIAYALLLLNTDLHVADIPTKMSRAEFMKNTFSAVQPLLSKSAERVATPLEAQTLAPTETDTDDDSQTDTEEVQDHISSSGPANPRRGSLPSRKSSSNPTQLVTHTSNGPAEESRISLNLPLGAYFDPPARRVSRDANSGGKALEAELEALLKDMYNSVKAQQILQPISGSTPGSSSSLAPTSPLSRTRSQRLLGGPSDRMKRGSIRGLQTLLGTQSPYGSNSSSSVDGRISPSPSFATSVGDAFSAASSTLFTPTLGFASNLSHSIIKEIQEDDRRSVRSVSSDSNASISDEELALLGAPWAKEGTLCRKQYWETTKRRAKDKSWMEVFVVIQKGTFSMFTFGDRGAPAGVGGGIGGGNWLSNAKPVGAFSLAHSLAHGLPPPGYNRQRPHCFVLTLSSGVVFFFQAGTEDLVNEWVSTCNYWAARQSKEPLSGGVTNMEYGWNRLLHQADDTVENDQPSQRDLTDTFSIKSGKSVRLSKKSWGDLPRNPNLPIPPDRMPIHEWRPPIPSTMPSTHDEEVQLEALQKQVASLKKDLAQHNDLRRPMQDLFSGRTNNATRALNNWEQKSKYLLAEIIKYESYVDSLQQGMLLRLKKRGEKVLEKTLVSPDLHDNYDQYMGPGPPKAPSSQSSRSSNPQNRGVVREETIQETEEPLAPGSAAKIFVLTRHKRKIGGHQMVTS